VFNAAAYTSLELLLSDLRAFLVTARGAAPRRDDGDRN